MLEGRKLSLEMQRDSNNRVWTFLSLLISLACVLLLASLWIGLAIVPPAPDKSQDNVAQAHAKVLEGVDKLKSGLAADQVLTAELFAEMAELIPVLDGFAQASAKATQAAADSRDAQIWPGRANLILDDLNTLMLAKEPTLNFLRTRDALSALYRPKGAISPQASASLSAFHEFSTGVEQWVKLTTPSASSIGKSSASASASAAKSIAVSAPLTWDLLLSSKTPWRQINAQMDALEAETKLTDSATAAQAKAAQTLLIALNANNLVQSIRSTDEQMSKVWAAHERLLASLNQLPPVPNVIVAPAPFSWSQLAFPGKAAEGLMGAMSLLIIGLAVLLAAHISRQQHLQHLSKKWLSLTQQLENTLRDVTQPLATSIIQQEELIAEFNRLLEQSKLLQQTMNTPIESPEKSLEDQVWRAAARMQSDLESELMILREKLLNIHLQFCSGATHENLVYDLAFTAEGIQTVLSTASDLGRSFALLKEHLHQTDAVGNDQEVVAMMSQISNLKTSVKRMTQQLRDLSNKLQVAVEDVPDGKRFESANAQRANEKVKGRPHGNPSV
jgi:hypothetical protein